MASTTAPASQAEPLPGPPPTPTSLMDLPAPWRLQLVTSSALDREGGTLAALFSTCTFFRDTVLRNRTAIAKFEVTLTPEVFPAELEKLCTVARRGSRVRLEFESAWCSDAGWMETEPHISHLLVCAMGQLGGEQPLACVKEIKLDYLEHTALVPAWVKVLCPNATKLDFLGSNFPLDLPHQAMLHPHLQHLGCICLRPPTGVHVRQQLSALPSLSSLNLTDLSWAAEEEDEQQARRLISSTVTLLRLDGQDQSPELLQHLSVQFPSLRELHASFTVDDAGLEALLSIPHLQCLHVDGFSLTRSHTHRTWQLQHLTAGELDVQSFARLPLDSIQACSQLWGVAPSTDAAAVARVARAVRRCGGLGSGWIIRGSHAAALLTTLGPLLAALPAVQQQRVRIRHLQNATSSQVKQLCQQLPASVTYLELYDWSLPADAWPMLLPSLPASVEVCLASHVTEQQVVAMCRAAVRPVKVLVQEYLRTGLSQQDLDRITRSLARGPGGRGKQRQKQRGSLVTLHYVPF